MPTIQLLLMTRVMLNLSFVLRSCLHVRKVEKSRCNQYSKTRRHHRRDRRRTKINTPHQRLRLHRNTTETRIHQELHDLTSVQSFDSTFLLRIPLQDHEVGFQTTLEMPIEVAEAARYLPERIVAAWQIKLVLGELVQEDFKIFYADHDSIMSYISENSNCE